MKQKFCSAVFLFLLTLSFFVLQPLHAFAIDDTFAKASMKAAKKAAYYHSINMKEHKTKPAHSKLTSVTPDNEHSFVWPDCFSNKVDTIDYMSFDLCDENYEEIVGNVIDKIEIYQQNNLILSSSSVKSYSKRGFYTFGNTSFKSKFSNSEGENTVDIVFYRKGLEVTRLKDFVIKCYGNAAVSSLFPIDVGVERQEFPVEVNILNANTSSTVNVYYTDSEDNIVTSLDGEISRTYNDIRKTLKVSLKMSKDDGFDDGSNDDLVKYQAHVTVDGIEVPIIHDYHENLYVEHNPETYSISLLKDASYRYQVVGINLISNNPFKLVLKQNEEVINEITDINAKFDPDTYSVIIDEDITNKISDPTIELEADLYTKDETLIDSYTFFSKPEAPDITNDSQLTGITLNSSKISLETDNTFQLEVTANYSDDTTADITSTAKYLSSNVKVATVDSTGLIQAVSFGSATISVKTADGKKSAKCSVTVTPKLSSIQVTPESVNIEMGKKLPIKATAVYEGGKTGNITKTATWSVEEDSQIISVASGVVTGITPGETTLTVSYGNISVDIPVKVTKVLTGLTISSQSANLHTGDQEVFEVLAAYNDDSEENVTELCTWKSGNVKVASVDENGVVTAGIRGKTKITASYGKYKVNLNVNATPVLSSISILPNNPTIYLGKTQALKVIATYVGEEGKPCDITKSIPSEGWINNDPSVVTLTNGKVKANNVGAALITVNYEEMSTQTTITCAKKLSKLIATPSSFNKTITAGQTKSVIITAKFAVGEPEDVTALCDWATTNEAIVYGDSQGIHAVSKGSAKITASWQGKKVNISVTVL